MDNNKKTNQLLEDIKKLLMLGLVEHGVQGKRMAEVLGVDPAVISRTLSSAKKKN